MATSLPSVFKLERYFAEYEFNTKHLLCCSDVESLPMSDVINMADPECKALWDNLGLGYTESTGHPLLRAEVAKLHDVTASDVLILTPQEGIYLTMYCLVHYFKRKHEEERPHVVATFPAYQSLYENLETLKCQVDYWKVSDTEDGWKFQLSELKELIRPETRLLVVNFPHNPTGYYPSQAEWEEILELCKERGIFLFSDEMYRLTNNDDTEPLVSACAVLEDSITLFGMSKTFAMPGLRLGWLCTRNKDVMESIQSFKDYTTICCPGPSEILTIIGLRNREQLVTRTMEIIHTNLKLLEEFFKRHTDIFCWQPGRAGTTGLLKLRGWALEVGPGGATGFCQALVKHSQVLLLPSRNYDMKDDCVRLSMGRRNMAEGLQALETFIQQMKH